MELYIVKIDHIPSPPKKNWQELWKLIPFASVDVSGVTQKEKKSTKVGENVSSAESKSSSWHLTFEVCQQHSISLIACSLGWFLGWQKNRTCGWDVGMLQQVQNQGIFGHLWFLWLFFPQKQAAKRFWRSKNTNTKPLLHTMTHEIRMAHFANSYDNLALQSGDYKACDQMFEALKLLPVHKTPFGYSKFGEAWRGKEKNQPINDVTCNILTLLNCLNCDFLGRIPSPSWSSGVGAGISFTSCICERTRNGPGVPRW